MIDTRTHKRPMFLAMAGLLTLLAAVGVAKAVTQSAARPLAHYPVRHLGISPLTLGILGRAPTAADVAASRDSRITRAVAVLTQDEPAVPETFLTGAPRTSSLRIALAHLGTGDHSIFVIRTSKGRICEGLTAFSSGCLEGLPIDVAVTATAADPDRDGGGEAPLVWGIARDEVKRVDVVVDGTAHAATFANNAYFYELPSNTMSLSAITSVVAHLASGDSVTTAVMTGPAPGIPIRTKTTG